MWSPQELVGPKQTLELFNTLEPENWGPRWLCSSLHHCLRAAPGVLSPLTLTVFSNILQSHLQKTEKSPKARNVAGI